ncbi:MAG TPA: hypothetical protein VH914_21450 [Acidimicrobiia bacterium]|jgi:hypothetical protein|nr:hypothetical protein [Acidimicrobiia bacterium]
MQDAEVATEGKKHNNERANEVLEQRRTALEAQLDAKLYASATRYAKRRAEQIARVGGLVDDQYIEDLVHGAIADTFIGVLDWDQTRASLLQHVLNAIKSRSRNDRRRAIELQRISLDVHDPNDHSALRAEFEAVLSETTGMHRCSVTPQRLSRREDGSSGLRVV